MFLKIPLIECWNVAIAQHSPEGMTRYSKCNLPLLHFPNLDQVIGPTDVCLVKILAEENLLKSSMSGKEY